MKNKLTNNIGLKFAAVLFAALLWLIVVNVDDPVDTNIYRNIPVTVTNEEVVTNTGKTYQILDDTQTVTVAVTAPRSVLSQIKTNDIKAEADMREMELKSLVPVTVTVDGFEGKYESAEATPRNIQVKIEDQTKNTFPLSVDTTGTLRDGYVLGETKTNPETITIRGSESLVATIDKAVARVNISGLAEDKELDAELILYDAKGNVIDQTLLTNNLGEKGVSVDVQVLSKKDLTLDFEVSGSPANGYVYTGLTSTPDRISVCGTAKALKGLDSIQIPSSELDISGATGKEEIVVDISPYLPEGVELVDDTAKNVIVTVTVELEGAQTIEFPVEGIVVNNLASGLKIDYEDVEDLSLQFKGSQDALNSLDVRNGVSIDLKDCKDPGTYIVPVSVEVPESVTLVTQPSIKILLQKKEE